MLNNVSLIRSVVGRVSIPSIDFNCNLFALPAITRMVLSFLPPLSVVLISFLFLIISDRAFFCQIRNGKILSIILVCDTLFVKREE